jgi:thiol-disulfide isomerase/thioredoxin
MQRIPSWVIAPALIGLSLGTIWVVGKAQMRGESPTITATSPGSTSDSPESADTSPASAPTPDDSANKPHPAFPDFSGRTVDGATFTLSSQKGKVVLINYWATWCGPCRMEIPDLIAMQKKYGPRGFVVVGLSEDDDFAQAAAFANQNSMIYPVLKTPENLHKEITVDGLPTSFLLDRNGKVIKSMSGVMRDMNMQQFWAADIEKAL